MHGCKMIKMASKDKKTNKKTNTGAVVRRYWRHTLAHPWLLGVGIAGVLIQQATNVIGPLYLRDFINDIATLTPSAANAALALAPLGIYALVSLVGWVGNRMDMGAGLSLIYKTQKDLMDEAFSYLTRHSYQFFSNSFAGTLTRRVTKYKDSYERLYFSIQGSIAPAVLFIAGATIILLQRNLLLGGLLFAWVVTFVGIQWGLTQWQAPLKRQRSQEDSNLTGVVADAISNQNTIALFSGNEHERNFVRIAAQKLYRAYMKTYVFDMVFYGIQGLLAIAANIGLLWVTLHLWQQGLVTIGDFILIQSYVIGLLNYTWGIGREFRTISFALTDAGEMVDILDTPHEIADKKNAKRLRVEAGEVWFDDVSFDFHKGTPILHQFNLTIAGGERVALVGPSGAGKSTVTKLLLRLYDVGKGEIKIDKQDISKVTQDSLRDAIAFVPQEPILFHRTLMENIRYGYRDATDEQVIEAAKKAHCHEFISKLPLGYETFVGERGIKLSGGERQRVAIARAILKDAPVLVLDEATSSLDSESEALIQDALNILMEGKTVIVIAHRLSTIMKMDRIVVMENGAVVAQGTHLQLIKERGLYQKLWSIQAGGFLGGAEDGREVPEAAPVELEEPEDE
jgi:ATP-binding cassette subfamily B protein